MRCPVLVVVSGAPAAGKTTLARELAGRLGATMLSKDHLKEALFSPLHVDSQEASLVASRASRQLIYSIAEESAAPLVVEADWRPSDVARLLSLSSCVLQIYCEAPVHVLRDRAVARVRTGLRHSVHRDRMAPEVLADVVRVIEAAQTEPLPLDVPLLRLDTSEPIDLDAVSGWVEHRIDSAV